MRKTTAKTVYFIKPIGMDGPIKVGCSAHPDGRKTILENWSPFPLEIVARIAGGYDLERRFHAYFARHHQRREWFHSSPLIRKTIAAINAGHFDISILPEPRTISNLVDGRPRKRSDVTRLQLSYSLRITHMLSRTGYAFRARHYDMIQHSDAIMISYADAYLRDPTRYGDPIEAPWARRLRGEAA